MRSWWTMRFGEYLEVGEQDKILNRIIDTQNQNKEPKAETYLASSTNRSERAPPYNEHRACGLSKRESEYVKPFRSFEQRSDMI